MSTSRRKIEHLNFCAHSPVESRKKGSGFDDITLIHRALPEVNMDEIDLSTRFLGKDFSAPFMIASITGGHEDTIPVNRALAKAVEEMGVGIGVGSQRAAIEDPAQEESFRVVRDEAPNAFIYGNVGAAQIKEYGVEVVEKLVDMIDADAMAVHLNFLQEAVQPEGDRDASGTLEAISEITSLNIPVIAKETGAGISHEDAVLLKNAGVSAIDVGGVGGTSWSGVEFYRAKDRNDLRSQLLGEIFWDHGIPTASDLIECDVSLPLIATGGIRSGLDIAKSVTMGADVASAALPFVEPALKNEQEVINTLSNFIYQLKVSMFLCGCKTVSDLRDVPAVVTGWTREYLLQRGFEIDKLSMR
ncbi:isopentenyl-diphosphate delta-isomerase, type 2 [Methanohalobium evestigatum Z-7303]|uniref:Isopentenyl-diphosphate delta-isomerase n=1 Tax=Methanohalobium evestigatum (strain ATCC BAA-1072 / DSM 3721 / NBRC 107634 / OCM 161 / Z-7303) TaxID=644295 RepID=D7E6M8_METEZ|nr:type 2 isopentenyl-diphosphate Delta-isomerase [Methanohalobium evestigatum]ADI73250.1 isopentenyl-diphosphate delta-isomerase, type 2 [Methanohalobium evestigatum Z-7303]